MEAANQLFHFCVGVFGLAQDAFRFLLLGTRSSVAVKAENLYLRKQLALYVERKAKLQRASDATRLPLVLLSRSFVWRDALSNVKPDTFLHWHRKGFRLLWGWKSRPRGRLRLPVDLLELIVQMARGNPTWGEERIAAEQLLKLGIRVSPQTVRRSLPGDRGSGEGLRSLRWMTFVRNHAQGIAACDFFVAVTATFRVLYGFVILEVGSRRIVHCAHPTADWTLQQFREAITGEQSYRFMIHDRDSICSTGLDAALTTMGVRVLKTAVHAPQANAFCDHGVFGCCILLVQVPTSCGKKAKWPSDSYLE
jgi:putative transposase